MLATQPCGGNILVRKDILIQKELGEGNNWQRVPSPPDRLSHDVILSTYMINLLQRCVCKESELKDIDPWDRAGPYPGGQEIFISFQKLQKEVLGNLQSRFSRAEYFVKKKGDPTEIWKKAATPNAEHEGANWVKKAAMPPVPERPPIVLQIEDRVEEDGEFMVAPLPGRAQKRREVVVQSGRGRGAGGSPRSGGAASGRHQSPRGFKKLPSPRAKGRKKIPEHHFPNLGGNAGTGTTNWWAI